MEKNHKIALVTYSLSSGGLERIVANQSVLFDEMGCEVHIYVLNSSVSYPYSGELFLFELEQKSVLQKIRTYIEMARKIKSENYDLILDHRFRLNRFTEFFWQKVVYNGQEVFHFIHSSSVHHYLFKNLRLNRLLFRNKKFVAVSGGITSIIEAEYPDLDVITLYNAVSATETEEKIPYEKYILAVARMDEDNVKQIDVLLECFSKSLLVGKGFKLVVIGGGEKSAFMKSYAARLNISASVVFTGFLPDPYPFLKNACFTVLTSKYEGLPTVLIESLMLGTPVVSFNCKTGPDEIIVHQQNGLLVENQNKDAFIQAMNRLVTDTELYDFLKSNAKNSVSKFSIEKITAQWNMLLNDKL